MPVGSGAGRGRPSPGRASAARSETATPTLPGDTGAPDTGGAETGGARDRAPSCRRPSGRRCRPAGRRAPARGVRSAGYASGLGARHHGRPGRWRATVAGVSGSPSRSRRPEAGPAAPAPPGARPAGSSQRVGPVRRAVGERCVQVVAQRGEALQQRVAAQHVPRRRRSLLRGVLVGAAVDPRVGAGDQEERHRAEAVHVVRRPDGAAPTPPARRSPGCTRSG